MRRVLSGPEEDGPSVFAEQISDVLKFARETIGLLTSPNPGHEDSGPLPEQGVKMWSSA